ncbi:MAG: MFS transporter [Rhodocyclaceae bacterium]|nr:MFS transporter [Rhodocyclaceae bacterium]MBK6675654.1 MFS transporter [Rhodocyclaceae bacterium]MBK9311958.1 MFS transporter [Rhodocyclaceae bacterium]
MAHEGFRPYFLAQAISVLGTWIQQIAIHWLVYRLSDSAGLLGITAFATMAPQLIIGPVAGAWIDRHDLRKLLVAVQMLLCIHAAVLAWITWTGIIGPGLLVGMSVALGVLASFDIPLRQTLISHLVHSPKDLPSAMALNSMILNAGRLLGPPLAGLLIASSSEAACFFINSLTFLAPLIIVTRLRPTPSPATSGPLGRLVAEGIAHVLADPPLRALLTIMALLNLTASAALVLLPAFAKDVLAGDARTLGLLSGAAGLGAFIAMIDLARRSAMVRLVDAIAAGTAISAVALLLMAAAPSFWVAALALLLLGFGTSVANVAIGTLVQTLAPPVLRGRLIAWVVAARFGFDALGSLVSGFAATQVGVMCTLFMQGGGLAVTTVWLLHRHRALKIAVQRRVV